MSTRIFYNGVDVAKNFGATPLVGRDIVEVENGERLASLERISLHGVLTGNCLTFAGINSLQTGFLYNFRQDWQTLQIYEQNQLIYNKPYCKISNIQFGQSNWVNLLPFSITLESYPQNLYSGTNFGCLDLKNSFEFQESNDHQITLIHDISCRGFNTDSGYANALTNAQNWVYSQTGFNNQILPYFIKSAYPIQLGVREFIETVNRVTSEYSVRETYKGDLQLSGASILRYVNTYSSGVEDGISRIQIQGNIDGNRAAGINAVTAQFLGYDFFSEAISRYNDVTSLLDLNPIIFSSGIGIDPLNCKLNFNLVWTNDVASAINLSYRIGFNYNFESDVISTQIEAVVKGKGMEANRWSLVKQFASGINLYNLIVPEYQIYANSINGYLANYPLNPKVLNQTTSFNEFLATVTMTASFDNFPLPPDSNFNRFDYSLNFLPAINQFSETPCLSAVPPAFIVFNLGYANRAQLSIQANGVGAQGVPQSTIFQDSKNQVELIANNNLNGASLIHLDSEKISQGNASFNRVVNVSATYSYNQPTLNL